MVTKNGIFSSDLLDDQKHRRDCSERRAHDGRELGQMGVKILVSRKHDFEEYQKSILNLEYSIVRVYMAVCVFIFYTTTDHIF